MGEPGIERLRMLRGGPGAGTGRKAHDERHVHLAAQHEAELRRLVDDLLHRKRGEVGELELEHRLAAGECGTNGDTGLAELRDRRVHHAVLAIAVHEVARHLEGAAIDADVLTHQEDGRVGIHRLGKRLLDGLRVSELAHHAASLE